MGQPVTCTLFWYIHVVSSTYLSFLLCDRFHSFCLQRYLEKFRVAELKELLRSMGVTQKGRKTDLLSRANELMRRGNPKIQHEIRMIYERTHLARKPMKMTQSYTSMKSLAHHHHLHHSDTKSHNSFVLKDPEPFVIHPDVKFKSHPFYQVMECIIRPTALGKRERVVPG